MNILVIDDDASLRRTLRASLEVLGHEAVEARDGAQALDLLSRRAFDTALLDLRLAQERGLDLLPRLLTLAPGLQIVVVTAYATIETAVEAMRRGAFDYLPKPFTPDQLRLVLDRIARLRRLQNQVEELEEQVRAVVPEADLQTNEPKMRAALGGGLQDRRHRGHDPAPRRQRRRQRGLRPGNPRPQQPSEWPLRHRPLPQPFGGVVGERVVRARRGGIHRRGAGHDRQGRGRGRRLPFLDEIGDLPLTVQPKLLRLLQERRYERVGETTTRVSDARILAATNRDLQAEIVAGRFREDLFYRLNVIEVTSPRCASGAATSSPWPRACCDSSPGKTAKPWPVSPTRRGKRCSAIPGPATSANCATPSSGA